MATSIYDYSIPVLIHGLTNLTTLLDKAAAYAVAKKFEPAVLAQARLYPDMLPLVRQVQIACDSAKGAAARLADVENPAHADDEASLDELKARIAKTIKFLESIPKSKFDAAEDRAIELKFPAVTLKFTGLRYLLDFVLPNFFFHETIVYALLRHNGVELGKRDFLGAIQ